MVGVAVVSGTSLGSVAGVAVRDGGGRVGVNDAGTRVGVNDAGGWVAVNDGGRVAVDERVGAAELDGVGEPLGVGEVSEAQTVSPFSTWQLCDSTARSMASFSALSAASKPLDPLPPAQPARSAAHASATSQLIGCAPPRRVESVRRLPVRCIAPSPRGLKTVSP
jgi:hypothetical protein